MCLSHSDPPQNKQQYNNDERFSFIDKYRLYGQLDRKQTLERPELNSEGTTNLFLADSGIAERMSVITKQMISRCQTSI